MFNLYRNSKYFLSTMPKNFDGFIIINDKTVWKSTYTIRKLPLLGATESHNNPIKKEKEDKNSKKNTITTNNKFII